MRKIWISLALVFVLSAFFGGCSPDDQSGTIVGAQNSALSGNGEYVDLLVGFSKGRVPEAAVKSVGGFMKREFKHIPIVVVSIPVNKRGAFEKSANVLFVEEEKWRDYVAQVLDWGVDRVDGEYVWTNTSYDGSSINVAVLDSGGDMDHPDITWAGGYSATNSDVNYWEDKVGHGTHCSGIISADNNTIGVVGVAPNCNIYMVQVGGRRLSTLDIIEGLDWVIATHHDADPNNDMHVISMSFGGGGSDAEEAAMQAAYDDGILLLAASGNESGAVSSPANYDCVMAVSASTSTDAMASFSNTGPEIELIAPGYNIYSTYKRGKYIAMSGTSMACPMAAGAAVLAWSAHPTYTNVQMRALLNNTAEDIGLTAYQQGNGLVDAENATLSSTSGDN